MKIINRHFKREFEVLDQLEAGIVLSGAEVKSVKAGNIRLEKSFAKIIGEEVFLVNAEIQIYRFARPLGYDPTKMRKLLLHRKEIVKLMTKIQSSGKLTLVPRACYTKGRRIKISLALVKGRGEIAKKKLEMKEDIKRAQEKEMKEYLKN